MEIVKIQISKTMGFSWMRWSDNEAKFFFHKTEQFIDIAVKIATLHLVAFEFYFQNAIAWRLKQNNKCNYLGNNPNKMKLKNSVKNDSTKSYFLVQTSCRNPQALIHPN